MGIVSTTDKSEALKTGKEYLSSEFYKNLPKLPPKTNRCRNCNSIISPYKIFCDDFCRDDYSVINMPSRKCKMCGASIYFGFKLCNNCNKQNITIIKNKTKKSKYKNREYKYSISKNRCLQCGGEIIGRNHVIDKKIFCERSCCRKYNY